jgi:Heat induced stress protein YflT
MSTKVTHLFDDYAQAQNAVRELEAAGFSAADVSVVSRFGDSGELIDDASGAATGASIGAVAGAGTGLLTALGVIAIPGLGPLVAAGVLATMLAGTAAGAVTGGLVGALTDYGVSEEDAHVYSEGVRRGGTLVTVQASDDRAGLARDILNRHDPVDIPARRRSYTEEGWTTYDPAAPGYTRDQVRAERDRYRR